MLRTTLLDRLHAARRTPVVVVEAPAGSGKTTAVAQWVEIDERRVGWYTIDESDDDPSRFAAYLTHALAAAGAEPGASVSHLPAPAVIVLDGVHLIRHPASLDALCVLLDSVPAQSQVVLVTRSELGLPLERMRAEGRVFDLGAADIRMSDVEAGVLLRLSDADLGDDDVRTVNARCEGWVTGLSLVALTAATGAPLHGGDRFMSDYFRLEILDGLSQDDRDFLVDIAAFDRVSGPLCDAVLDRSDAAAQLSALERLNVFLVPLGDAGWFSLYPLFREMLQTESSHLDPGRSEELLGKATDWYESQGDLESAIDCAIAAGDRYRAAALLPRTIFSAYWNGRSDAVARWCAAVDDEVLLARHPVVALLGAGPLAIEGRADTAERWAEAAYASNADEPMPDGSRSLTWIANVRAMLCRDGVATMRSDAELAAETLAAGSPLAGSCLTTLGFAYVLDGDDERAAKAFAEAVRTALPAGEAVWASAALAALSVLASNHDDKAEADELAHRALEIVGAASLNDYATAAYVNAAYAHAALHAGRRSAAREALDRATRLVPRLTYGLPWLAVSTRLALAHTNLAFGEPAHTRELLKEIDEIFAKRPDLGILGERTEELRHELEIGRSSADGWVSTLTPAEYRLLPLLASHLTFREISERLEVSRNTVKTQAIAVYRKLDVSSRSGAVERALALGLVGVGSADAG